MKTGWFLLLIGVGTPQLAYSLERNDTMVEWLRASQADRSHVLDELEAKDSKLQQANRAKVIDCMNGAAEIAGHSDLRIADVAEACSEPPSTPNDKASTDI